MAPCGVDPMALDQKLQDVKKQQDVAVMWPQRWWPFADSQHDSEAGNDSQHSSIGDPSETLAGASVSSGGMLPTSLHKRKFSVQDIWHDANLRSQDSLREQELQSPKHIDEVEQSEQHLPEAPMNHNQRRLPPRVKTSRSNLRLTKMAKKEHPQTIYHEFNEEGFGEKQFLPLPHHRTSLVFETRPMNTSTSKETADEDETQEYWEDTITENSLVVTAIASKIHSPGDETLQRHDSGFALPVNDASSEQSGVKKDARFHDEPCSPRTSPAMKHDMQMVSVERDPQAVVFECGQSEHGSACTDFDFGQQACVW